MSSDAEICWPENFMCIGGRTFSWVYANRKEFVEFTAEKMDNPSGLFKQWKNYVIQKQKETDDKEGIPKRQGGAREANEETKDKQVDKETKGEQVGKETNKETE